MKILFYSWDIYDENFKEISMKPNGGSIAIKNICDAIGEKCDMYLFLGQKKLHAQKLGNIHIVETACYPDYIDESLDKNECRLRTMLHAFEMVIEDLKPDFVNLHGGGELTRRCIWKCIQMNQLYALTDHLYIGMQKQIEGYESTVEWEKQVYSIPGIQITTVGKSMKESILRDYPAIQEADITTIVNGTDFQYDNHCANPLNQLQIENKRILLCVGTINKRKNQSQIVRAYALLPQYIQEKLVVLFCGNDAMNGELQEQIQNIGLNHNLIYAGCISNKEIKNYYNIAQGYILASIAEGLSLTMLEALIYGLPLIMFDDLEGADELKDQNVTEFIYGKDDQDVSDAIMRWYQKTWDKDYIRNFSEYFNMDRVSTDYINYYTARINSKKQKKTVSVSVIIPVYKGNQYIPKLIQMLNRNWALLVREQNAVVQVIFVNDYPQEKVCCDIPVETGITITILENETNLGIHRSRVCGLKHAIGQFILFLDQDDVISDTFLSEQLNSIGNYDAIVCNGKNCSLPIYENDSFHQIAITLDEMKKGYNRIVSPGQVLLRKESIPVSWTKDVLNHNGADDYYLWFLMLLDHKSFGINPKMLYLHTFTGNNSSENAMEMQSSVSEMIQILKEKALLSKEEVAILIDRFSSQSNLRAVNGTKSKYERFTELLDIWLTIMEHGGHLEDYFIQNQNRKIAIYGYGMLGRHMVNQLKHTSIQIAYIMDKRNDFICEGIEKVQPGMALDDVDTIVVTPFQQYREIKEELQEHYSCNIVSLETVIKNIDNAISVWKE